MEMDFSGFKNYYFMRCFPKEEYREQFNSGDKLYINSAKYFHDLDNKFQQDFEGGIFRQIAGTKAYLLKAQADLTTDEAIDKVINSKLEDDEWILPTSDFRFFINGYILSLTIIPKCYLCITDKNIIFNEKHNISEGFYYLLNQYAKDKKYTFISLYDAEAFMRDFSSKITEKGYQMSCRTVDYEDLTQKQRCQYYAERNFEKLIFTKNKEYSYQHEFRILLQQAGIQEKDHIEEYGIDMRSALLNNLVYLTPEYMKEMERSNEIQF